MDRRDFLRIAGAGTGTIVAAGPVAADHEDGEYPQPADGTEAYESKIRTLKYPLAGVPAVLERVQFHPECVSALDRKSVV